MSQEAMFKEVTFEMSKTDGQATSEKMQADGSMCMLPPLADSSPVTPAGNS